MDKIDKTNLRLLYALDKNARASYASVGRVIHRSAQEVKRRYDLMQTSKIVRYAFPIVEYRAIGLFFIIYLLKLHNLTKEAEAEFYKYLNTINDLPMIVRGDGHFDVMLGICSHGMFPAERVFQEINSRFSEFIMSYETMIPTSFHQFRRGYLSSKIDLIQYTTSEGEDIAQIKIKEDGLRVLEALNADSRQTVRELSTNLNMSYDKVKHNIKKLEELGVIKNYTFLMNHNKVGFPSFRVHFQLRNLSRPKERMLFDYCNGQPNIVHYQRLLGAWQLALDIEIESRDALRELLRDMKAAFADMIIRVEPTNLYQIDRYRYLPLKLTWAAPIVSQ